jgi:hypothetical protein
LVRLPKGSLVLAHLISNDEVMAVYAVSRRNLIRTAVRLGCSKSRVYTAVDASRQDQRKRRVLRELATLEIAR